MNDNEIIDVTDLYHTTRFMRNGTVAWTMNRSTHPIEGVVIHHSAGWYGERFGFNGSEAEERNQLDSLAIDHYDRFGIGPGYHHAVFPSGRAYRIGRLSTQRAHTKGRKPAAFMENARPRWNEVTTGLVVFGDYEKYLPSENRSTRIVAGIRLVLQDVMSLTGRSELWVGVHGQMPAVNKSGTVYAQATACPGKNLRSLLMSEGIWNPLKDDGLTPVAPLVDTTPIDGSNYARGNSKGYSQALDDMTSFVARMRNANRETPRD